MKSIRQTIEEQLDEIEQISKWRQGLDGARLQTIVIPADMFDRLMDAVRKTTKKENRKMAKKTIELGSKVKDVITGIQGIAIGQCIWLTGCDQYWLKQQGVDKDGKAYQMDLYDVQRLIVLEPPSDEIKKAMAAPSTGEAPPGCDGPAMY